MIWTDEAGTLHEACTISVTINGRPYGEAPYDPGAHAPYRRFGIALFCPHCGEVWGRITLTNSRGIEQPYDITKVSCQRHPDPWNTPGVITPAGLEELLALLPPAAITREFDLELQQWIKKHSND